MIARLARRLGFQTSVPVSVIDAWLLPNPDASVTELAPRGGRAACLVDRYGRVQPTGRAWTLDWTLAAGARWVAALESERIAQRMIAPAVLETTVVTPSGEVVQRVAAAVVDGEPVAIVEFENKGGVAIAAGIVARPLTHAGRGHLGTASADGSALDLGEAGAVRFDQASSTAVSDGTDLLTAMPAPDAGRAPASVRSKSGGAQAAAVFPLPHTATLRIVVELGGPVRSDAAVPTTDDVQRGWARHLDSLARYEVGDTEVGERVSLAARGLLTGWPTRAAAPVAITALAELGEPEEATRLFSMLDDVDDDLSIVAAMARWAMLSEPRRHLDALDAVIGPVARAIQIVAGAPVRGPSWLGDGLGALADRLDLIDQPDVAARVRGMETASITGDAAADRPIILESSDVVDVFGAPDLAARALVELRGLLVADSGDTVDLLPHLPVPWRGRPIDAIDVPIAGGTMSFGLRWHGPRPALLWEIVGESERPISVRASAIDPGFESSERSGEVLLADPGWPRAS